jgi:molybdopterin biosynthesis enzyme
LALDEVLGPVQLRMQPVAPVALPPAEAIGLALCEDLVAAELWPRRPVALRAGLAVSSLDLVGASPHAPVFLPQMPPLLRAGDVLPAGCDAIIDPDAAKGRFGMIEVTESVAPGTHVRLAGHDAPQGKVIARAGATLSSAQALAAMVLGIPAVQVRRPAVSLAIADPALAGWATTMLTRLGCRIERDPTCAQLLLRHVEAAAPRLALNPGEAGWIAMSADQVVIDLPGRFDAAFGCWLALVIPALARLSGRASRSIILPLAQKISSAIGASEIALLATRAGKFHPLGVGDLTLASIASADAWLVVPPGSEGEPGGQLVTATPLDQPFGLLEMVGS